MTGGEGVPNLETIYNHQLLEPELTVPLTKFQRFVKLGHTIFISQWKLVEIIKLEIQKWLFYLLHDHQQGNEMVTNGANILMMILLQFFKRKRSNPNW